jgi:hypothetical protein
MTPAKTLAAAAAIAFGLMAVADSAFARRGGGGGHHGGGHRGGHHGGHHHHGHFGFWGGFWGPGYWGGWGPGWGYGWGPGWGYWGGPAIAYTPVVTQEPRVWVERDLASATPPPAAPANTNPNAQQWWYWCVSAKNYYPYVASCAEGWQRVAPQPTPGAQ